MECKDRAHAARLAVAPDWRSRRLPDGPLPPPSGPGLRWATQSEAWPRRRELDILPVAPLTLMARSPHRSPCLFAPLPLRLAASWARRLALGLMLSGPWPAAAAPAEPLPVRKHATLELVFTAANPVAAPFDTYLLK